MNVKKQNEKLNNSVEEVVTDEVVAETASTEVVEPVEVAEVSPEAEVAAEATTEVPEAKKNTFVEFFKNLGGKIKGIFSKKKSAEATETPEVATPVTDETATVADETVAEAPEGAPATPKEPSKFVKWLKKTFRFVHNEKFHGFLFILPWLIGFCAFVAYPIIQTLIFSFSDVEIHPGEISTSPVGFKNYIYALLSDSEFTQALGDYAMQIVLYVPVITVISLILAMLLNSKVKGTGFFRTIFFLPVIITSGPVIKIFIDQGVASFPGIEKLINFTELAETIPQFLVDALQFLTSEFIMILWFSGIQILVFMTGLQKMDKSMYEAAKIDGASSWEIFWKITLPALNPTIVLNVLFTVVMQSIFSLNPIILKIQRDMNGTGDGAGYGYASAMAWLYFIVMLVLLGLSILVFKKHERRVKA